MMMNNGKTKTTQQSDQRTADSALSASAGSVDEREFAFQRMHKHQALFTSPGGWEIDANIGYYSRIKFNMTGKDVKEAAESWTVRAPSGAEFYSQNVEMMDGEA